MLGIPANLPLILDDASARPVTRQMDRYYEVLSESDAAYKLVEQQETLAPEKLRAVLLQFYTSEPLVAGTKFREKIPPSWAAWVKLKDADLKARLEKLGQARRTLLDTKTDLEMKETP